MVPLVVLPMVVVVGVWLISGAQFLEPGRCVNVTQWAERASAMGYTVCAMLFVSR